MSEQSNIYLPQQGVCALGLCSVQQVGLMVFQFPCLLFDPSHRIRKSPAILLSC